MYYILTYDIAHPKRLVKVLKVCRKYLNWISRSVFEGNLSVAAMDRMLEELDAIMDPEKDSVILFTIRNDAVCRREIMGKQDVHNKYFI